MSEFSVSLAKLTEEANLTIAYTPCELDKIQVTATEVYRPGILLAGYYENFDSKRIQIIGLTEMSYLDELSTVLLGKLHHFRKRLHAAGQHDGRRLEGEQLFQMGVAQ